MIDENVTRPPFGMFCATANRASNHVLTSSKHSRT